MPTKFPLTLVVVAMLPLVSSCQGDDEAERSVGWVDRERLLAADSEPENWLARGRTFAETYYSPLSQIDTGTVGRLGFAWEYEARSRRGRVPRGLQGAPIVVDGVLYSSAAWGSVFAVDASTGEELWWYEPPIDAAWARKSCCGVVNRGIQVWKGRVYVGTFDGYLVALDAATGEVVWKVDTFVDRSFSYAITSPPQIAGNRVVIGNSGADFGVRGYVSAYDLETGEFAWRFFTVPGDPSKPFEHPEMEMAAKTWDPNSSWASGLGGTVWAQMTYDPELNLLYFGTGNSSPYPIWFRSPSGGDNLFLVSIIAVNPDDGRMAWYYQTTPSEIWDYTATSPIVLADLDIDGVERKVLMQAPKNGFFYVLDRATGELISAENFVTVTWASHVDLETGRPVFTEQGNYQHEPKVVFPASIGGHNWQPMSYHPGTGLVYIPAREMGMYWESAASYDPRPEVIYQGIIAAWPPFPEEAQPYAEGQPDPTPREMLIAWDPVAQREVWNVPLESLFNGGVLSTGGNLVVQGTAGGDLVAYRADTGEELVRRTVGTGIMAAPITYEVDGEQYVAVLAGYGGGLGAAYPAGSAPYEYVNYGRLLAFKLDGGEVPLPPRRQAVATPEPPELSATEQTIAEGAELFAMHCAYCHGGNGEAVLSAYPDVRRMTEGAHAVFNSVVRQGVLREGGMASFADVLDERQTAAVQAYLISEQHRLYEAER